jgi:hypothetical protein
MTAQASPAPDEIRLSALKTRRDFRVSVALLVAGVAVTIGFYGFVIWANSSGFYPSSVSTDFLLTAIGGIGSTLILVGAIFTGINWSLLRKAGRGA